MSVTVSLCHRTDYHYPSPASLSPHIVRLRPAPHARTPIRSYALTIEPADHLLSWHRDPYGNHLATVILARPVERFAVEVRLEADLIPLNPFEFLLEPGAERFPVRYSPAQRADLATYLRPAEAWSGLAADWLASLIGSIDSTPAGGDGPATIGLLLDIAKQTANLIDYEIRYEPGVQTVATTFERRAGSCRDSAWLLVETFRRLGLAARFVSGYLIQLAELDSELARHLRAVTGPVDEDTTDLHAWTEVYLPGAGWVGIDPTSGLAAGEGHIPLAATPTPQRAAPISGSSSVTADRFDYRNVIERVDPWPAPDPERRRS